MTNNLIITIIKTQKNEKTSTNFDFISANG